MEDNILDFINNIQSGNMIDAENNFNTIISSKVSNVLDIKKQEFMANAFERQDSE